MSRPTPIDIGLSSAEIIMRRVSMIWWHVWQPTAASRAEMITMVVEKQMAFAEACFAMQVEAFKMMLGPWKALTPELHRERMDLLSQAALAPVSAPPRG